MRSLTAHILPRPIYSVFITKRSFQTKEFLRITGDNFITIFPGLSPVTVWRAVIFTSTRGL